MRAVGGCLLEWTEVGRFNWVNLGLVGLMMACFFFLRMDGGYNH